MKNQEDQCFKWCIARALNPNENKSERIDKKLKLQAEKLNWKGINFPVSWHDIDKFERCNEGLRVNVFGYDGKLTDGISYKEKHVYPLRLSKVNDSNIVDLLLILNGSTQHYCLIKSLSRLLTSQTGGKTMHYCRRCLHGYRKKEDLAKHEEY